METTKDIGRLVIDLLVDVDIKRTSKRRVEEKFGKTAVAGIEETAKKTTIYISKGQQHAETIRCVLHELSHYYESKYKNNPMENHDEEVIEQRAANWQKALYGDEY